MDPLKAPILPVNNQSDMVPKPKWKPMKSMIVLAFIALGVTTGVIVFPSESPDLSPSMSPSPSPSPNPSPIPLQHSIIIDAGSSGTRLHVFKYRMQSGLPVVSSHAKINRATTALSSFVGKLQEAEEFMQELVDLAKEEVTDAFVPECEIRLMATAGMRLLEVPDRDAIFNAVKEVLNSSGFKFQNNWVSIISGFDEGLYAWVIANFALDSLVDAQKPTTGIIELGGASAQMTFVPGKPMAPEYNNMTRTITFGGVSHTVYSNSFLSFGLDKAREQLRTSFRESDTHEDPCTPQGYSPNGVNDPGPLLEATGNYAACKAAATRMMRANIIECSAHCYIGTTLTPLLHGNFLALGSFFYTSNFFKLARTDWLTEMVTRGNAHCGKTRGQLETEYPDENTKQYLDKYCFSTAYIGSMLQNIIGFNEERITFANKAGRDNLPLDWAMGAFVLHAATNNSVSSQNLAFSNLPVFKI